MCRTQCKFATSCFEPLRLGLRDSGVQWHADSVERSISAPGVFECWSLTHRSESVERINHPHRCMPPAAVSRILAPVVVTLAKTSHMCRTGASRWIHRACACTARPYASNRATRVAQPCQRNWPLSSPVASQENLSSCIRKFAIVMPGKAPTEIDNTRHERRRRTQLLVLGETLLGTPTQHARQHVCGRDAKRTCCREHPACPCSVLHCTCAMWIASRQCQPRRQHRPCTPHEGQLLRTSLRPAWCPRHPALDSVGRVLTEMSCRIQRGHNHLRSCEMWPCRDSFACSICLVDGGELVCSFFSHTVLIYESCALRHAIRP